MIKNIWRKLSELAGSFWVWISGGWDQQPQTETTPAAPAAHKSLPIYTTCLIDDDATLPKILDNFVVYIVGIKGHEWLVVMACPCGCGSRLSLNLLEDESPCWTWRMNANGLVTLSPSVWRKVGCRSHFFLRAGTVHWCFS